MAITTKYIGGLDLGQMQDFSALPVLRQTRVDVEDEKRPGKTKQLRTYELGRLERFDLGTSYNDIVAYVCDLCSRPPFEGMDLAIDKTGVGTAVYDMFTKAKPKCSIRPITITGGSGVTEDGFGWKVAKKELVSALQVVLQADRIKIATELKLAGVLVKELENFRVKITSAANEQFEAWRERDHDDMVLGTAMAVWLGERGSKEFWYR